MDLFDIAVASKLAGGGGGGGGGNFELLLTESLGHLETTSTSATNIGKSLTVENINDYDMLIVMIYCNNQTEYAHKASVRPLLLRQQSDAGIAAVSSYTPVQNYKVADYPYKNSDSNSYGVYPFSVDISDGVATITIYMKYNSTYTGTINGDYTACVYGLNLHDLMVAN